MRVLRRLLVLLLCLLALLLLIGFDQVEARKRRKKGLQGQNVPAKTNSNNKNGEEHANHKGTNSQKPGKTGHKNRRTGDAEEGPHQQKSPKNGDDHANHKGANNSQKPGKKSDNEKKTGHKNRRTGEAEEGPHQQKSSKHLASDFKHVKVPDAEQHKLFLECTVKQRVKPGNKKSILKTLFAHTAMGHNSALFYDTYFSSKYPDLSYNAFVASRSLLTLCEEDDTATKPPAIEIVSESYENGKVELRLAGGKNIVISKRSSSGALGKCQDHKGEPYQIFKCTGDLCDGTEVVLTQRPSRWNIEQSYFAKKELPELEKVCGLGETMHEVFDKGSKVHEGQKTKQHKLFRECAVKRSDNNRIETLVMYRPVSSRQTLFFSKGSHLYVAKRTATVREVCETKAGNMAHSVPIVHAVLTLAGQQEGKKKKKRNDNKILFHESGQSAAETLGIDVRDMDSDGKRICSAYTKKSGGGYHLFLCPPNVCGKTRLFMLRKRKMKQQDSLIDMADGEHVFIDRLCVVDLDENVLQALMRRCNNKLGVVEGLTRDDEKLKKKTNKNKQKNKNKNQKKNKKGNQMDDDEEEANPNDNNKDNEHDVHENKDEKHHEKDGENAAEASYTRDGQRGKKEKGEQKQKQKMENSQQQKLKVQNNQQQKLKTPKLKPKAASAEAVMGNRKHSSMEDAKHNKGQKRRAASAELHKEKAEQHQQQHKGKEETAAAPNHNGKADAKPQKVAIDTDKLANSNNHNGNGAANNHESKSRQSKLKNKSAGF